MVKLGAKEMRYLDYAIKISEKNENPNLGEMCSFLHTTPLTLLTKTIPKIEAYRRQHESTIGSTPFRCPEKYVQEFLKL